VLEGPGAEDAEPAVLWSGTCDEPLLSFAECENIELRGLTLSRAREGEGADATCAAPLIAVRAGYRLTLEDCVLTGAGTAAAVTRFNALYLVGVTVTGCQRALEVRNSKHLGLERTVFRENTGSSLFSFRGRDTRHVSFTACKIEGNELGDAGAIFDLDASSLPIDLIDCLVTGNTAGGLATGPGARRITLSGCQVQDF